MFGIAYAQNNLARMTPDQRETKDWIKAMAKHMAMSPSQLALKSGMAASTVTRYLNDETGQLTVQQSTLEKIAQLTGFRPHQFPGRGRPGVAEPDAVPFDQDQAREVEWVRAAVASAKVGRNGVEAWVMKGAALDGVGVMPGDIVIIDHNLRPRPNDIIIAQIVDYARAQAETVMRIFQPPFICSHSIRLGPQRPEQVDEERVQIMGVAIGFIRPRH